MSADQDRPWFAPKRFGYGTGLPIAWQGWAVLVVYILAIVVAMRGLPLVAGLIAVVAATAALIAVCKKKTAGGWRWRDGN